MTDEESRRRTASARDVLRLVRRKLAYADSDATRDFYEQIENAIVIQLEDLGAEICGNTMLAREFLQEVSE